MTVIEASKLVEVSGDDYLEILRMCGGYYSCPKDSNGKRLGPLVGYAGKYPATDGSQKQFVGDIYANFAKAEEYPHVLKYYTEQVQPKIAQILPRLNVFCGAPIGGYSFADMLGLLCDRRVIKAEKKVTKAGTKDAREESNVIFGRHSVNSGDRVIIMEDVCNNFATTDALLKLIDQSGGTTVGIICLLNRSLNFDNEYFWQGTNLPVISLIRMKISQFQQDDPFVSDDIVNNNIVWKTKDEWDRLMKAMRDAGQR